MSMLLMTGQLLNVFRTPVGINKEGKEFGGKEKIQILGSETLQNGETQNKLIDLSCHDVASFEPHLGKQVTFPVGVLASGKSVVFYVPKGATPDASALLDMAATKSSVGLFGG
jgi:hypothetical protein|uniref:Uncharacterized protein n=1 Tax=uncultured prokaryote TaxID=198431 RepID=A0A0H5Q267_9ZZZZ|nr:hypothetical protein [uncultured prokaryote]